MNYSALSLRKTLTNEVTCKSKRKDLGARLDHNIINLWEGLEILENTLCSHRMQNIDFSSSYLNITVSFELVMC